MLSGLQQGGVKGVMAETAGRGGRAGGRQSPSAPRPAPCRLVSPAPGTWWCGWPLPIPGPGVMCGGVPRVRLTQCALCLVRSDVGSPRPRFSSQIPTGVWGNTRCGALCHVWELLVLAQRDGERQRNPAFRLRTCRRRFYLLFLLSEKGAFIPNGCRCHMWSRSYSLSAEPQAGCCGCLPDTWPSEASFPGRPGGPQGLHDR